MRPIDFCHPERTCVHPHLVSFPAFAAAAFTAWMPRRVWALRGLTGGPSDSRRPNRFGGSESCAPLVPLSSGGSVGLGGVPPSVPSVGVFFPRRRSRSSL
jgi:hypothetical protein